MNREQIKELALTSGFKLKPQQDGTEDLHPYVYEFAQALMAQAVTTTNTTAAAEWREAGKDDPHSSRYDCERAALAMGSLTDDQLANAVFTHDHRDLDLQAILAGEPSSIGLLTAAKDRIRWLSRALTKSEQQCDKLKARIKWLEFQAMLGPDDPAAATKSVEEHDADVIEHMIENININGGDDYLAPDVIYVSHIQEYAEQLRNQAKEE